MYNIRKNFKVTKDYIHYLDDMEDTLGIEHDSFMEVRQMSADVMGTQIDIYRAAIMRSTDEFIMWVQRIEGVTYS